MNNFMTMFSNGFIVNNRKQKNNPAANREAEISNMLVRTLTELCVNRFEWKGLPDTVNARYLELALFKSGTVVFYDDPDYGFLTLEAGGYGQMNMYGDPTTYRTLPNNNSPRRLLTTKECVPIWSNYLRRPDWDIVSIYASRIAALDRTIEINATNARRSRVIAVSENMLLSGANINKQIDDGSPSITVKDTLDMGSILTTLDLGVNPDHIEKLHILRTRQYNEAIGLLGINNANQDKKERLVEAEVGANDEQVLTVQRVNLNARQQAAEAINRMFGTNVTVDYYKAESIPPGFDEEEVSE